MYRNRDEITKKPKFDALKDNKWQIYILTKRYLSLILVIILLYFGKVVP